MTVPGPALVLDPSNPFAAPSRFAYGLPDFAAIRDEHYSPAFLAGMALERAEVEAILTDGPPTEENTLVALERAGALLHRVTAVFFNRTSSDGTPALDDLEAEIAPLLSEHHDAIDLDPRLLSRLEDLAARVAGGEVTLADDAAWLLTTLRRDLRRLGAAAAPEVQDQLRALNSRISTLETTFGRVLLAEANDSAVLVTDLNELDGLAADAVAAARQAAADRGHAEGWLLELSSFSQQPVLAALTRREVRRRVHEASLVRGARGGEHDTRATLLELVRARAERARLLGYDHHAAYVADDGTARTTQAVLALLTRAAPAAAANARREAIGLQVALQADEAGAILEGWDWPYYAEKVRRERYALDDAALRPYLELDRVVHDGVFHAATALYGITFTERPDLVGYHPQVRAFEVHDADHAPLGLFLADWYTRASKRGGAWMNNLVDQNRLRGELPVVVNNLNIPRPPDGEPTLLTWDEVITLFHEFGHALHGLLSDVRLPSQSGTEVPQDVVEFPSQVNEMWAWDPSVLARYAVHHRTGEPMPAEWVTSMLTSRRYNQGFATTEYLAAALLDQAWHQLTPEQVPNDVDAVEAFEAAALEAAGVAVPAVASRYRTAYFNHVFGGGYAAAYYAYFWAEVLDADTVQWFSENAGLRRENGDAFRAALLGRGGSGDVMGMFRALRGRDPVVDPLLERRGLVPTAG